MPHGVVLDPGKKLKLARIDPAADGGLDKQRGGEHADKLAAELGDLQQELYAAAVNSVLIVLQGPNTSGKDGTIRRVFSAVNPQGCEVTSFKRPNPVEESHDYLWRIHRRTPAMGMLGVFNRSHYEDVLVPRVHGRLKPKGWKARYRQINDFEAMLDANGTIVVKFYLHISKEEQARRLLARQQEVEKAYKLSPDDWREREHFDDYLAAYEDLLRETSTAEAPWTVVPADRKWFRNLAVAEALVARLRPHRKAWQARLKQMSRERLEELRDIGVDLAGSPASGYGGPDGSRAAAVIP